MPQQAFVLRINPSDRDKVSEALNENQIIIGWATAKGLLDTSLTWEQFRKIIQEQPYYSEEKNLRRIGNAAGQMWRFIKDMKPGDLVVVPHFSEFYVAEVNGPATYDPNFVDDDTAYRRPVKWLNDKKSIPRSLAKTGLISRMKAYGTCSNATDLLPQIEECLKIAKSGQKPTFQSDLQSRLIEQTLDELRRGRIDDRSFENLISCILLGLGAKDAIIVPRQKDKGADILAKFNVAGAFSITVAVQAKHWQPDPPVGKYAVDQVISGIEAESANLGMVITSGSFSDEANDTAKKYFEEKGIEIKLVDGLQFAKLIVEQGISLQQA